MFIAFTILVHGPNAPHSLSYLGDINLPPQVVEEILQQLRR